MYFLLSVLTIESGPVVVDLPVYYPFLAMLETVRVRTIELPIDEDETRYLAALDRAIHHEGGGYSLRIELLKHLSSERLFHAARDEGIAIAPDRIFSQTRDLDRYLHISPGTYNSKAAEGGQLLVQILKGLAAKGYGAINRTRGCARI